MISDLQQPDAAAYQIVPYMVNRCQWNSLAWVVLICERIKLGNAGLSIPSPIVPAPLIHRVLHQPNSTFIMAPISSGSYLISNKSSKFYLKSDGTDTTQTAVGIEEATGFHGDNFVSSVSCVPSFAYLTVHNINRSSA